MKAAKERKMDRKRKHKALAASKTEKSRQRRLDNKAKRAEIHAIDPDMKVRVIDQVTYDENGAVIKVENDKITKWLPLSVPEVFKSEPELKTSEGFDQKLQDRIDEIDKNKAIDAKIEKERLGVFNPFKWKKKLTL